MLRIETVSVPGATVDEVYANGTVVHETPTAFPTNAYALFTNVYDPKHAAIVRHLGHDRWQRIRGNKQLRLNGIDPRDAHQTAFMDCLVDPKILLNVAVGTAGTGKTTLALSMAAQSFLEDKRRILLSKPTAMVGLGKAFGPVPGDIGEKYAPYLASYQIVLNKLFPGGKTYVEALIERKDIEFIPVELARGCTFENCTFILDEAQNLTWHELNTIISRIGENAKMVILGDLNQIDIPLRREDTGLYKLIASPPFQRSHIASSIELVNQYRSPITALVADVNEWVNAQRK